MPRQFAQVLDKAIRLPGLGLDSSQVLPDALVPLLLNGKGAPTLHAPSGSWYADIDADGLFYFRRNGAWVQIGTDGSVKTDTVTESTSAAGVTVDGVLLKDGGATLKDDVTFIVDPAAPTKRTRIDSGAITAGQTRAAAMPDRNVDLGQVQDAGTVASARLALPNLPTTGDTVTIGADVYQFRAAAEAVTNDAYIAVAIGGSAAVTRTALIAAINATLVDNEHPSIFLIDTVTPALANGTEAVVADEVDTTFVRIRSASAAGGTVTAADPSIVLAESITDAADIWDVGNVNLNTLGGRATGDRRQAQVKLTITTAMIANDCRIDFPFTPVGFSFSAFSSAGVQKAAAGDSFTIAGDSILLALAGTGAPALVNTDVVYLTAWGA